MLFSLIFTCATIFSEPTQIDTIFSRQDTRAYPVLPDEYKGLTYQQDLRKVLVIVDCTVWDDGTVSPRAICEVVYVPEPATLGLAAIILLRRRCDASLI